MKSRHLNYKSTIYITFISFLFFLFNCLTGISQNNDSIQIDDATFYAEKNIHGIIINEYNKEPIPFVNIIINNTLTGTAADEEGYFSLPFPGYYSNFDVNVSAIGYTAKSFAMKELMKVDEIIIELKPINYEIQGINIKAESKVLYGLVKKALKAAPTTFIHQPFKYNFTYKNTYIAGNQNKVTTSKGYITDSKGYIKQSLSDQYKSRSYRFTESDRNFKLVPFSSGLSNMDMLLEYDLVRSRTGIFALDKINNYQLELVSSEPYNGDTLMRIVYNNIEPNRITTGDAYIKYYEGEVFILKNKNVILKCIIKGSSSKRSIYGKSFFVKGNDDLFANDIRYVITVNYHSNGEEYHLSSINMNEEFITLNKQKGKSVTQLIIPDHELLSKTPDLEGRDFYNNPKPN